jgi:hypothetical protein
MECDHAPGVDERLRHRVRPADRYLRRDVDDRSQIAGVTTRRPEPPPTAGGRGSGGSDGRRAPASAGALEPVEPNSAEASMVSSLTGAATAPQPQKTVLDLCGAYVWQRERLPGNRSRLWNAATERWHPRVRL